MADVDHSLVNFGQEHELNRHLRKAGKRQTQENRDALIEIGKQEKQKLGKARLQHGELEAAIAKKKNRLE
ncbi:hypothetical protein [Vibrio sp. SCSIO 43137]|uniref:hypothetical protein n=1 Tax=Vibrio sp. SCSIO 43137 TaxID=3021011 RepID=UPI002307FA23|nr:hypothetical protein [Vibrio sp. SCSIO 43137]WCE29976.1 hypothetical protein PK654_01295 [Vibrio sp. SCSIO 43137]